MVRYCCVCKKEDQGRNDCRSFHKFPKEEEERNAWLKALGRSTAAPSTCVCSDHFKDSDYFSPNDPNRKRRSLKRGIDIVPSVNLCVSGESSTNTQSFSNVPKGVVEDLPYVCERNNPGTSEQILQDCTNNIDIHVHESSSQGPTPVHNAFSRTQVTENEENIRHEPNATLLDKRLQQEKLVCKSIAGNKVTNGSDNNNFNKRRRDDDTDYNEHEQVKKKIKLCVGYQTMTFGEEDFRDKNKYNFFVKYFENQRSEKKIYSVTIET